ncbi:MAG TPA: hypothetical protein VFV89_17535 [Nocardioides sp.]|uniref:hypothetical protein n=1 Tax=Nocardioides sp. TaxID=35761 RepID=UPI002E31A993|nr:hypothetical protein [Nocardioides sp.]HEX5089614.1 hypothetical protein [Nocardioides sp.]
MDPEPTDRDRTLDAELERIRAQRAETRNRHSRELTRLLSRRQDLKGVHALADLVNDSLRWSA